jgi:hypothetical protein
MLKIALLGALAVASVIASHRLESTGLAWLVQPPPSGNTFGAVR